MNKTVRESPGRGRCSMLQRIHDSQLRKVFAKVPRVESQKPIRAEDRMRPDCIIGYQAAGSIAGGKFPPACVLRKPGTRELPDFFPHLEFDINAGRGKKLIHEFRRYALPGDKLTVDKAAYHQATCSSRPEQQALGGV